MTRPPPAALAVLRPLSVVTEPPAAGAKCVTAEGTECRLELRRRAVSSPLQIIPRTALAARHGMGFQRFAAAAQMSGGFALGRGLMRDENAAVTRGRAWKQCRA